METVRPPDSPRQRTICYLGHRDAEAITILKNCRTVIPENGSLLIVEFILPSLVSHADPQLEGHLMSDFNMLAVTGGKRTQRV